MSGLADRSVLVLGLGDSGLAMARWCVRFGARVRVWDSRDAAPHDAELARELPQAGRLAGALAADALDGVSLVLKSPGLAPHDARIAPVLAEARARGLAVLGELDLFVRALAELEQTRQYRPQLVAITGTNGKTTTTAMAALLIGRAGRRVAMAGNVGPTLLDTLAAALDAGPLPGAPADESAANALPQVWVLELSSFQLEGGGDGVQGFEPDAAAVLNVSEDHLDWHGSMDAYARAKARIFGAPGAKTVMVINRDDPRVEAMVPLPPPAAADGKRRAKTKFVPRRVQRFGLGPPQQPGDWGVVDDSGMAWLVRALPDDEGAKRRPDAAGEIHLQRLMPADALRVRGRHNAANALAALALASAIGCPLAPMLHGLREYPGEPHRVQFVAAVDGVEAYDDSKGTNVGATVAALEGLGADKQPARLVVILGGDGKGQDFAPLAAPLARHARAVATIGRDAPAIEAALAGAQADGLALARQATLEAATAWCFEQARPGDAVLLSPACASLDMFRNYAHRAEVFVAAVRSLARERGGLV
ncbi:MAG: UDP-N-acetylmuramoyl-L-alanine--D-glutamate ligase [Burkholderiales bacterium]|nr:UDP-N-acetylmuramoyl-L-alanine--D-glutamate ligase [Burkholderiales bacterium]